MSHTDADSSRLAERALQVARQALDQDLAGVPRPSSILFLVLSGDHAYGTARPETPICVRGAHALSLREVIGLAEPDPIWAPKALTTGRTETVDVRSDDVAALLSRLLRADGAAFEEIYSPHVLLDCGVLEELRQLAHGATTRQIYHHYRGIARTKEKSLREATSPTLLDALALYRALLSGLRVLSGGGFETNLSTLNRENHGFAFLDELIERRAKSERPILEKSETQDALEVARRLGVELDAAVESSLLPETVENHRELDEFLVRTRLDRRTQ